MALLEALIIGLMALIVTPSQFFYFDVTPKVVVLLAGTAILLILAARGGDRPRGPVLFGKLLLANAASLALSTLFSTNRNLSVYGSTWRNYGAVVQVAAMIFAWLVAWNCTGRPDRVRIILRGITITGAISAAYGIAQYFGWDPILSRATYLVGEGIWTIVRPPGTLGYSSYFATWLLVTVFLCLALVKLETNRIWRIAAQFTALLSIAAMALTGTRAALLGLAAGIVVWLFWSGFRIPRRGLAAVGVVLLCAVGFYFSPAGQQMRSRSRWFSEDPWGGARLLLWRDSLAMGVERPLAGFGPEVFLGAFPHYESVALAKAYPDFVHESPHNIFLDALVSQGIPGLLVLCGLAVAGFAAAWRLRGKHPAVAGWLAAALAAAVVSQQFTAFTVPTALLFFVTIALIAGMATEAGEPHRSVVLKFIAPIAVLALLYPAVRIAMADRALAATKRLMEARDYRAATKEYEAFWFWHLPGASADLWYSRTWMAVARQTTQMEVLEQAIGIAEQSGSRATDTAEEPFAAWYNLAQISALHDDYGATETSLRRAIDAHPNWFKPHWLLAQELRLVSRLDEAAKEAALAVQLDNGHDPEVTQTLQDIRARQAGARNP